MKSKGSMSVVIVLILALFGSIMPACGQYGGPIESYVAVVPKVLYAGGQEAVSLTLFDEDGLTSGRVDVALVKEGKTVVKANKRINGKGKIEFTVPSVEEGVYEIRVKGDGFEDKAEVRVERTSLVFLETDKPIYKPGQTVHMRVITLDTELRPASENVTVEILDAKGIKIFRKETITDEYGTVTLDLPVSQEPNLGVWKIKAASQKGDTQLDVRIEEYVLPKYEVKAELPREWFLVTEPITGNIVAEYSYGKSVRGELSIKASRYLGEWEQYATFNGIIDGEAEFELPAVNYVAGVPAAGGLGNVMLDITVRESATGYEESSSMLLTVSNSSLNIQVIPEGSVFKPGLPFSFLLITETPDNKPLESKVDIVVTYLDNKFKETDKTEKEVTTSKGKAIIEVIPPEEAVALVVEARSEGVRVSKALEAGYSPSGNFIHVEQISEGISRIGEDIIFKVYSTEEAVNFYYEVVSRDKVVFTDFTSGNEISFVTTPQMTPSSRLLIYQILPNSEVAADYIPFKVEAQYPHKVTVEFNSEEAKPGEKISVDIKTEGKSKVGIAAVDKSVFILAENRLNLQQVFDELERLYMEPQAELHEFSIYNTIDTRGAKEIFDNAGVVVLSNNKIPEGKEYKTERGEGWFDGIWRFFAGGMEEQDQAAFPIPLPVPTGAPAKGTGTDGLAEIERIRQYFPETWIWDEIITDSNGEASLEVEVPDTITTWMLRAIALSMEKGLGIAEAQVRAFQPFFLKIDLPYSAIREEEFPVKVAVYNYLDESQSVMVQIQEEDWFDLLDESEKTVEISANDLGGVEFKIRPRKLGLNEVKVTARSKEAADAVIKTLIVEPEGIAREVVENLILSSGNVESVNTSIPPLVAVDSGRAYVAVTSSYLTQTIEGLDGLLQMPFGCGEQNMILFAPDVYITKYLKESGQLKPEIMAKAEKLMITGYQRELIYRRSDGSFSAFGENDREGSLFLTAFVLKSFSQARDLMYIDDTVLSEASSWITSLQNADGSFDPVGFVAHDELMGGLQGKNALTAYVAIALMEAGDSAAAKRAIDYLESELDDIDSAYNMAIVSYALELAESSSRNEAYSKLMEMAQEDENGLHWGDLVEVLPLDGKDEFLFRGPIRNNRSAAVEATGYAALALTKHADAFNASQAAKWLVSQRNAYGGYGSTQDTVVALQALTEYSSGSRADVDLMIHIEAGGQQTELRINQDNFDVLQIVEVPVNEEVNIDVQGRGEAIAQVVKRFNIPEAEDEEQIFMIDVDYNTTQVEVNDIVEISVEIEFNPPIPMEAGMVVLDVSIPTGFSPVTESIAGVVENEEKFKRYDIAGRKVIFYIENMLPGDNLSFTFEARAMYPVKAKGTSSQAYSYYKPEIKGEVLSQGIVVSER